MYVIYGVINVNTGKDEYCGKVKVNDKSSYRTFVMSLYINPLTCKNINTDLVPYAIEISNGKVFDLNYHIVKTSDKEKVDFNLLINFK